MSDDDLIMTSVEESAAILVAALQHRGAVFTLHHDGYFHCDLDRADLRGFPPGATLGEMVVALRHPIRRVLLQGSAALH